VTNWDSNSISVIDIKSNNVITTVPVGVNPCGAVFLPDGTRAYVANYGSNSTSVVDAATNKVIATVNVETAPIEVVTRDFKDSNVADQAINQSEANLMRLKI
jgi:YVTN family beta-propeller protein